MAAVRQYLISVITAAIFYSILESLLGKKGIPAAIGKLISGLFLVLTIIRPLADIRLEDLRFPISQIQSDGALAVTAGEADTRQALAAGIKQRVESYILDKAAALEADLAVEVILTASDPPVPAFVRIQGTASPYARAQLSKIISDELGIPKEEQQWIG